MEEMLKAKELAKALNVNVETVRRWTRAKTVPYVEIGKSKRYSLSKVMAALESPAEHKTEE